MIDLQSPGALLRVQQLHLGPQLLDLVLDVVESLVGEVAGVDAEELLHDGRERRVELVGEHDDVGDAGGAGEAALVVVERPLPLGPLGSGVVDDENPALY